MKCKECGSTQVGAYKEVRGVIAELGITKEYIQEQIAATVDSMVRSALSENIHEAISKAVVDKVRSYGYSREFNNMVDKAISEEMSKLIMKNFTIKVELKKE